MLLCRGGLGGGGGGRVRYSVASEVGLTYRLSPSLVVTHNMSGTHSISMLFPRPTISLTPGRDVFLRKWLAIWSERPHICPANEKAGLLPNPLPKHCPYPHGSRPPSSWSNNNTAHMHTWQYIGPKYCKKKKKISTEQRKQAHPHSCATKIKLTSVQRCSRLATIRQQSF